MTAAAEILRQAGTSFEPPTGDAEGLASIRCHDPDGNAIRLFAWPAQSA